MRVLFVNGTAVKVEFLYSAEQVGSRVYAVIIMSSYLPWREFLITRGELIQYTFY